MKNVTFKTRHALVLSCISLMTCFAMLLGTTFAWFTDSVTSGVNRIIAGNLDIEATYWNGTNFDNSITSTDDLFVTPTGVAKKGLWEPGHVEVAYLKITNAGTLALNYKLALDPSNEVTGTSVNGNTIKLSDILQYKLVDLGTDAPNAFYDRDGALQAAGTAANLSGLMSLSSQTAIEMLPNATQYKALIVYMPETTGNEANYRGDNIPEISFALSVVASQMEHEVDSFDKTYDQNAAFGTTTVSATASEAITGDESTTLTVAAAPATGSETKVEFTANALTGTTASLTVETKDIVAASSASSFTVEAGNTAVASIDLTLLVDDVKKTGEFNTATVTTYIAKGLTGVNVKYNGTNGDQPTLVSYDADTGKLVFTTNHFSEYYVTASNEAYIVDTNTAYATLAAAVNAAADGGSIILLKDVNLVAIDKNVKVVGNGTTVVDTKNVVTSKIQTLKNVTFENIVFKSTSEWTMNSSGMDWTGIFSTNTRLEDVTFTNCTFSTKDISKTNCIYNAKVAGNVTFDGCTIYGNTYGINFANIDGTLTLKNCDISGWNSFGGASTNSTTGSKVVIENSNFHKSGYNKLRFYENAEIKNSTFDCKFLTEDMTGGDYGDFKAGVDVNTSNVTIKFIDCKVKNVSTNEFTDFGNGFIYTCTPEGSTEKFANVIWQIDGATVTPADEAVVSSAN